MKERVTSFTLHSPWLAMPCCMQGLTEQGTPLMVERTLPWPVWVFSFVGLMRSWYSWPFSDFFFTSFILHSHPGVPSSCLVPEIPCCRLCCPFARLIVFIHLCCFLLTLLYGGRRDWLHRGIQAPHIYPSRVETTALGPECGSLYLVYFRISHILQALSVSKYGLRKFQAKVVEYTG